MPTNSRNYRNIQAGDACTVYFPDGSSNPPIEGTYQKYDPSGVMVVTTPRGETDPTLQTVHYIRDFCEVVETPLTAPAGFDQIFAIGDSVEVVFGAKVNGQPISLEGTIVAINNPEKLYTLDTTSGFVVIKDFWYATKL